MPINLLYRFHVLSLSSADFFVAAKSCQLPCTESESMIYEWNCLYCLASSQLPCTDVHEKSVFMPMSAFCMIRQR
jgi:hypothetical protein